MLTAQPHLFWVPIRASMHERKPNHEVDQANATRTCDHRCVCVCMCVQPLTHTIHARHWVKAASVFNDL